MFLSKRSNGIYYLWFDDETGRKQKVSTGCTHKPDAIKFFREFKLEERHRKAAFTRKSLREFFADYQAYSGGVHTPKTQHSIANAFRELLRIIGDVKLEKLGIKEIEGFLAQKKAETSEWTARKYYIHLTSAFETARRWNFIAANPFKKVQKPKTSELQPLFFTRDEMRSLLKFMQ